ncbi:OLC1v1020665C1 [Oldenlandia corymbosa var. corymbosa]|uniref:OLC1v1020665C1 n=1 Tax=Oldenlandia corymbosa var. corymbosa TaxID=529605 RepID=A0AAV1EGX7_OLDCO|nr:OLC1v1020665C1 [Oldenlandia corymbosa var. corymbosa]
MRFVHFVNKVLFAQESETIAKFRLKWENGNSCKVLYFPTWISKNYSAYKDDAIEEDPIEEASCLRCLLTGCLEDLLHYFKKLQVLAIDTNIQDRSWPRTRPWRDPTCVPECLVNSLVKVSINFVEAEGNDKAAYKYNGVAYAAEALYTVMFYMFRPVEKNGYFGLDDEEEEAAEMALQDEEFEL